MSSDEMNDLAADMEMSTKEAAAYLSGPVGDDISTKFMYGMKSMETAPGDDQVVELLGRSTLDISQETGRAGAVAAQARSVEDGGTGVGGPGIRSCQPSPGRLGW